jgi:hypothetical protein
MVVERYHLFSIFIPTCIGIKYMSGVLFKIRFDMAIDIFAFKN